MYVYLLNKREESALRDALEANDATIIDASMGYWPISPNRKRSIAMGVLIGLLIPSIVLILRIFTDNKVHSRKDLEGILTTPYLGDIPFSKSVKKQTGLQEGIAEHGTDMISEAFRILRTNLNFVCDANNASQAIILLHCLKVQEKHLSPTIWKSLIFANKR